MTVIVVAMRLVMGFVDDGAMPLGRGRTVMRTMVGGVVLGAGRGPFARKARARTGERDNRGQDGAE